MLRTISQGDTYQATYSDPRGATENLVPIAAVPYLKSACVRTDEGLSVFALNRDLTGEIALEMKTSGFGALTLIEAVTLHDADLKAVNTRDQPERIAPRKLDGVRVEGETLTVTLPAASWTLIRLRESG